MVSGTSTYKVCSNAAMLAHLTATFQLIRCKQAVSFALNIASSHDLKTAAGISVSSLAHGNSSHVSRR
jgi:hypothetical protein